MKDFALQFQEAQTALTSSDEQLAKVSGEYERMSGECERVSGEARGVSVLINFLMDSGPSTLMSIFDGFLESQAKLLTMQTTAVAVQSAPPFGFFTGEDIESEDNSFEHWLSRFEERSTMLKWTDEMKCYHLKQHLTKTASKVLDLLPFSTCSSYTDLLAALRARFKPIDIEELRGLEFHQLTQTTQSVEKLGLQLMSLDKKAFPTLDKTQHERLLKGMFFQALLYLCGSGNWVCQK